MSTQPESYVKNQNLIKMNSEESFQYNQNELPNQPKQNLNYKEQGEHAHDFSLQNSSHFIDKSYKTLQESYRDKLSSHQNSALKLQSKTFSESGGIQLNIEKIIQKTTNQLEEKFRHLQKNTKDFFSVKPNLPYEFDFSPEIKNHSPSFSQQQSQNDGKINKPSSPLKNDCFEIYRYQQSSASLLCQNCKAQVQRPNLKTEGFLIFTSVSTPQKPRLSIIKKKTKPSIEPELLDHHSQLEIEEDDVYWSKSSQDLISLKSSKQSPRMYQNSNRLFETRIQRKKNLESNFKFEHNLLINLKACNTMARESLTSKSQRLTVDKKPISAIKSILKTESRNFVPPLFYQNDNINPRSTTPQFTNKNSETCVQDFGKQFQFFEEASSQEGSPIIFSKRELLQTTNQVPPSDCSNFQPNLDKIRLNLQKQFITKNELEAKFKTTQDRRIVEDAEIKLFHNQIKQSNFSSTQNKTKQPFLQSSSATFLKTEKSRPSNMYFNLLSLQKSSEKKKLISFPVESEEVKAGKRSYKQQLLQQEQELKKNSTSKQKTPRETSFSQNTISGGSQMGTNRSQISNPNKSHRGTINPKEFLNSNQAKLKKIAEFSNISNLIKDSKVISTVRI